MRGEVCLQLMHPATSLCRVQTWSSCRATPGAARGSLVRLPWSCAVSPPSSLAPGLSIRFCSFEGASDNIWHILVRTDQPCMHVCMCCNAVRYRRCSPTRPQPLPALCPTRTTSWPQTPFCPSATTCASLAVVLFHNLRDHLWSCSYLLVEKHNMRPLRLYVYNAVADKCREVTITPNTSWGGEGRCDDVL